MVAMRREAVLYIWATKCEEWRAAYPCVYAGTQRAWHSNVPVPARRAMPGRHGKTKHKTTGLQVPANPSALAECTPLFSRRVSQGRRELALTHQLHWEIGHHKDPRPITNSRSLNLAIQKGAARRRQEQPFQPSTSAPQPQHTHS